MEIPRPNASRIQRRSFVFWCIAITISLGIAGLIIWVAAHFIAKYW